MLDINLFSKKYKIKKLEESDINDILELEKSNKKYFSFCKTNPTIDSVKEELNVFPIGKKREDKYFVGYYEDNVLIAILDLIDKYPNNNTVLIGLLMLNKKKQCKGIGTKIVQELCKYINSLVYKKIRLGCIDGNIKAEKFWLKNGFRINGEIKKEERYSINVFELEF